MKQFSKGGIGETDARYEGDAAGYAVACRVASARRYTVSPYRSSAGPRPRERGLDTAVVPDCRCSAPALGKDHLFNVQVVAQIVQP